MKPDSAHAEAAVRAYCRELCDPGSSEHAVTESLQRFKTAGSPDAVEDELLRITRTTVADQAHEGTGKGQDLSRPEREDTCARTPARLTASANHELQPGEGHKLEAHLGSCLRCQATELRVRRAERAFTATLAGAGTVAALSETAQPGARAPISETAGVAAVARPETPVARPETPVPRPERQPVTRPSREPSQPAPLRVRLLAVGGAMVTAGVVAAVLLLSGTSSNRGTAPFRHGSPTSFPSPAASAPTATTTPRTATPANAGASTAPSPAPSAANPGATAATSPVVPSPSAPAKVTSTPAAPRASGSNPTTSPTPAAPPTSPSSPSPTGMTMTQHGPSLSAVPAPTKGIGPGG